MQETIKVLRVRSTLKAVGVFNYAVVIVLLSTRLPFGIPDRFKLIIVLFWVVFGAFWLLDIFLTRIVFQSDALHIVSISNFQSRTVMRADIEDVTWEKGAGASIKLRDGKWIRLPNAGQTPQGLVNSIRAWLKG